jgi:hypothetical protein
MPGTHLQPIGEVLREAEEPYRGILRHVGQAVGFERAIELLVELQAEAEPVDQAVVRARAEALRQILQSRTWTDFVAHVRRQA